MWKRTDWYLRLFTIVFDVVMVVVFVACLIMSIRCFVEELVGFGMLFLLGAPVVLGVVWIEQHMLLSLYSDVKLIRDKLYEKQGEYSALFSFREMISPAKTPEQLEEEKRRATRMRLDQMLEEGVITQAQYEATVKKYC